MLVETYEVTETNPETGLSEFEPEALALIEELGLEGQRGMLSRRTTEAGETVTTRCPYREMTAEEGRVYGMLLPSKMSLEEYNRGPVPLRILQVAALAKREGWFDKLVVCCPESARDKDPLLLGVRTTRRTESWTQGMMMDTEFVLARWGEVLEPFEVLVEKARKQWVERNRARLNERLATVESAATTFFSGGNVWGYE